VGPGFGRGVISEVDGFQASVLHVRPKASLAVVPLSAGAACLVLAVVASIADPSMGLMGRVGGFLFCSALAALMIYVWRRPLIRVESGLVELRWFERGRASFPLSSLRRIVPKFNDAKVLLEFVFVADDGTVLARLPTGDVGWRRHGPWTEEQISEIASVLAIEYRSSISGS
jgi:hypothetical protein